MKETKKIVSSFCICMLILTTVVGGGLYLGYLLDPYESQEGLDAIDAFHSIEDNSLDVIVYGSSRAWKSCDTRVMYEEYGLEAYNYACNWQQINTTLLFLRDSLRTQTPKVACIEVGLLNKIQEDVDLNGEIYYTKNISDFQGKREYLRQCFGDDIDRYMTYYFPILVFHENWKNVIWENFAEPDAGKYIKARGHFVWDEVEYHPFSDYNEFEQNEIEEKSIEMLDQIVDECNKRGIKVIFFTCPTVKQFKYGEAMKAYAKERECDFLNLYECTDKMNLDEATDWGDDEHLNSSGSAKLGRYLAEYIIAKYPGCCFED